jgi:hypothetical protein
MISDDGNRGAQPRWPHVMANVAPDHSALPVPDAAAFEPDAVASEDAGNVQWPAQAQVTTPSGAKSQIRSRKHKFARASEKRRVGAAHAGKQEHRAEHAHSSRRARARAVGHHAEVTPGLKILAALITPGYAGR